MGLGFGDLLVGRMWTCGGGRGECQRLQGTSLSPAWSRPLDVTVCRSFKCIDCVVGWRRRINCIFYYLCFLMLGLAGLCWPWRDWPSLVHF